LVELTEADLIGAGMLPIPARKLVAGLKPALEATPQVQFNFAEVLPAVPNDDSWLTALKVGGVLKVDESTVIAAIRAGLADRVGLFNVPKLLADAMKQFAEQNDDPVAPVYFELIKQLTRRTYGDLFAALPGMDGSYVTEAAKKQLTARVNQHLWPAIASFNSQLNAWVEAWTKGMNNPMAMMAAFAMQGTGGALPPGMMQPPDTAVLRDNAEAVADAINKAFAGTGVQIAAAQAYDAAQIKRTLEDPRLPAMIGAANRDQMLKQLGAAVSSKYPRLETNLTQFVLGVLRLKDQPAGNDEIQYLQSLYMLGSQIEWDQLQAGAATFRG
jgi:hypothetical protein